MVSSKNILRRVGFPICRTGTGPTFHLTTWDTGRTGFDGKYLVGYRLTMREPGNRRGITLFEGEDFGCSPLHAIDSNECVKGIMAFLTLRPGDTDQEYFADYTEAQLAYCSAHAEALACEVCRRFGE